MNEEQIKARIKVIQEHYDIMCSFYDKLPSGTVPLSHEYVGELLYILELKEKKNENKNNPR